MDNTKEFNPRLILVFFILQVVANWLYMLWIEYQPDIIINSWFVILPMLFFFYFTFAFIAAVNIYQRKLFGLGLAACVLMFGTTSAVVSYNVVYKHQYLIEQLIVPLIIMNLLVIFYMAYHQSYFKKG